MHQDDKRIKTLAAFRRLQQRLSPAQMIALSFLVIILIGGLLLLLPIAQSGNAEVAVIDAFFTAVSAVCVTGLVTLTTATAWSGFGKIVILLLIQIGGLSVITMFTFFMVNIGKKISLRNRIAVQTAFNDSALGGMVRLVLLVIKGSLICELLGALLLFVFFLRDGTPWDRAVFYGIFHAVSAFCNAGFDIIGEESLIPYGGHVGINFVIMLLIILGGIGFIVWRDILRKLRFRFSRQIKQKGRFSLHTKLALLFTAALILLGTLCILVTEYHNPETLGPLSFGHKLLAALFQSVTLRTAGYATIPQGGLRESAKLLSSLLMLIGGSPGGTAGGMKTVTVAVVLGSVWSIIRGYHRIVVFKRTISVSTLQKALVVIVLMLSLLFAGTAMLSFTEAQSSFPHGVSDLIFELCSALGTVGLTTGITPYLSTLGKLLLMLFMFIGRIGPVTLIISLSHGLRAGEDLILYPHGDVMIG